MRHTLFHLKLILLFKIKLRSENMANIAFWWSCIGKGLLQIRLPHLVYLQHIYIKLLLISMYFFSCKLLCYYPELLCMSFILGSHISPLSTLYQYKKKFGKPRRILTQFIVVFCVGQTRCSWGCPTSSFVIPSLNDLVSDCFPQKLQNTFTPEP